MPSFDLGYNSYVATHIVVVTEGDKIDGEVEVLESWSGDLKKGDKLSLPDLAAFAPEKERVVSKRDKEKGLPASVSGARMVLFLCKKDAEKGKPAKTTWLPAEGSKGLKGMRASAAWIEGEKAFAFGEEKYGDPLRLLSCGLDEKEVKKKANAMVEARTSLVKALEKGDEEKVVAVSLEVLRSNLESRLCGALPSFLGFSGSKAIPALRAILKDDKLLSDPSTVLLCLMQACDRDAWGPELVKVLEQELAFWKKVGPDLPKGWLDGANGKVKKDEAERLRRHAELAYWAVKHLGEIQFAGGRKVVGEFGKFWKSLPNLVEANDLSKDCDATLKALPEK